MSIDQDALDAIHDAFRRGEQWHVVRDMILALVRPVGVVLTPEEASDAAEALDIAQESIDDYADQFSDVDARLDEGQTRATAARMRALAARLGASA